LLAVLYGEILRIDPELPLSPDRDRFLLSKGHGAAALYAVLAERGFFPKEKLASYCENDGELAGHVTSFHVPGIELSTGSLGHALPVATGMALVGKREAHEYRTFVLLSDGELDEGSNWEAALFAAHHQLDNLVVIIDHNKMQGFGSVADVIDLEPLADKWRAFGWAVQEIDGHDHEQVLQSLQGVPFESGKPSAVIAHTVKGKGVSFMENKLVWHYRSPDDELLAEALNEIGCGP
jgi:transketolase